MADQEVAREFGIVTELAALGEQLVPVGLKEVGSAMYLVLDRVNYMSGESGGGGVLLNGSGPTAQDGDSIAAGFGGYGYGAEGGAGGYLNHNPYPYYAGGKGVDGIVYVEW